MATLLFPRRIGSRSLAGLQRGFGGGWKGPSAAWGAERPPNPAGSLSASEEEEKEEAEPARRDARGSGRRGEGSELIASPCLPGVILSDLGRRISVPLGSGCHSPGGADRSRLEENILEQDRLPPRLHRCGEKGIWDLEGSGKSGHRRPGPPPAPRGAAIPLPPLIPKCKRNWISHPGARPGAGRGKRPLFLRANGPDFASSLHFPS